MKFQIEPHTLARAKERGTFLNEIEETITTGASLAAKSGRFAKTKVFNFEAERNGKSY